MENEVMGAILEDNEDPGEAATAWLAEHPEVLDGWLNGVTTVDGEEGLPAVKEVLGL
jgi:glycine betaine/proline transport system substrate-binding protein